MSHSRQGSESRLFRTGRGGRDRKEDSEREEGKRERGEGDAEERGEMEAGRKGSQVRKEKGKMEGGEDEGNRLLFVLLF